MLSNYSCSKCGSTPQSDSEVFSGCKNCGNKFFKFSESGLDNTSDIEKTVNYEYKNEISSISIPDYGVFDINVEKLMNKGRKDIVTVSDEKGVYHIKMKN